MLSVEELVKNSEIITIFGKPNLEVIGLCWDSRLVKPGDLFFAIPGRKHDGHAFIPQAIERGAVAVVGEKPFSSFSVPYIQVKNVRLALAQAACAFYGHPTWRLKTVAVTGTNGKTTVVHLLGQLLPNCETLTTVRVEEEGLSCVTTPEAPDLQKVAAQALSQGKKFFAFEASSIGLAQHRVEGVHLSAAVFTNLSRDHLEFHRTMEGYLSAKLKLFRMLPEEGVAVVNTDDRYAEQFVSASRGRPIRYGIGCGDVQARDLRLDVDKTEFRLVTPTGTADVRLPFPGRHNVLNALAASAVAWTFGLSAPKIAERLSFAKLPPGRFQRLRARSGALVVVDFAHNPDALAQMLSELRPMAKRLICVFGCAGESDRSKRYLMGELSGRRADFSMITSDNPKSEDPAEIAASVSEGVRAARGHYEVVLDRAEAIRRAVMLAGPGDVVLIAGKGHERFQWTAQGPIAHSDLDVLLSDGLARLSSVK